MQAYPMLFDGRMVSTPEQDPVINPATGAPFGACARAGKAHIDEAVGEHDPVAGEQRRRELPGHQNDREVPRRDQVVNVKK